MVENLERLKNFMEKSFYKTSFQVGLDLYVEDKSMKED